jgi:transcription elongation factor Elf1
MKSVKDNINLIIIILLTSIVIFLTLWDVIYGGQLLKLFDFIIKRQHLQRLLMLYSILIIIILVIYSRTSIRTKAIPHYGKKYNEPFENKSYHFKCPNCNGAFTIKILNDNHNRSFTISCPNCGTIGRIPFKSMPGESTFECKKCEGHVSITVEEAESFHEVAVHSCPYCGEKKHMRRI